MTPVNFGAELQRAGSGGACVHEVHRGEPALAELFTAVLACGVEDIWLEAVNARGPGLTNTVAELRLAGLATEANTVDAIRKRETWSTYATALTEDAIRVAQRMGALDKLHILLYPASMTPPDREKLKQYQQGIVWLGKAPIVAAE